MLELTLLDGSWLHQKDDLHTFVAEIQLKVNEKLLAGRIIYCCLPNFEQFSFFEGRKFKNLVICYNSSSLCQTIRLAANSNNLLARQHFINFSLCI